MTPGPLPRLYAILDTDAVSARGWSPVDVCRAWLGAGVRLIQLRAKRMATGRFLELADEIVALCRDGGVTLVINDRVDIAAMSGAGGVHLGQDDLEPDDARRCLGPSALIGLSTHDDGQVEAGVLLPVSYIAFGPVYSTTTKATGYESRGLEAVRRAAHIAGNAGVPLVAIGGITMDTAPAVRAVGADSIAVISDLLDAVDLAAIEWRARAWVDRLN